MAQNLHEFARKKRYKSWIILGRHKKTGNYIGRVENSFSMGLSEVRVRVYPEWYILYFLKPNEDKRKKINDCLRYYQHDVKKLNKLYPEYSFNLYRVGSKNCPVKINWQYYHRTVKTRKKFESRNLMFKIRKEETMM